MLQIKDINNSIASHENLLCQIFSQALRRQVYVIYKANNHYNAQHKWITFTQAKPSSEVALSCSLNPIARLLPRIALAFQAQVGAESFEIAKNFSSKTPNNELVFELQDSDQNILGEVYYSESAPTFLNQHSNLKVNPISKKIHKNKIFDLEWTIKSSLCELNELRAGSELVIEKMFLGSNRVVCTKNIDQSLKILIMENNNMEQKQVNENQELNFEVGIELGKIQIELTQLLDLRPSSSIELDRPEQLLVGLTVAGKLWAEAEVDFSDDGMKLRIVSLNELAQ